MSFSIQFNLFKGTQTLAPKPTLEMHLYRIKSTFKPKLLFTVIVTFLATGCEQEDPDMEQPMFQTVSSEQAQELFEDFNQSLPSGRKNKLIIRPEWNTFHQASLCFTDAKTSIVAAELNVGGGLNHNLVFLTVLDTTVAAIESSLLLEVSSDGKIETARVYYHSLDGTYLDGYVVEEGEVTKKLVLTRDEESDTSGRISCDEDLVLNDIFCEQYLGEVTISAPNLSGLSNDPEDPYEWFWITWSGGYGAENLGGDYTGPAYNGDPNVGSGSTTCATGYVKDENGSCIACAFGVDDVGLCYESKEDAWEDQINDSQLNPCMRSILNDLTSLTHGVGQIVAIFAGNTPGYNWEVKNGNTGNSNASTSPLYNNGVTTTFSSTNLTNATDLSIARTIFHEAVHAYFVTVQNLSLTVDEKSQLMGENWFALVPKLVPNQGNALFASNFVDKIAIALFEYSNNNGIDASFQYCKDLAWGGLTHYDPNGNQNYQLAPWFTENITSSTDRQRILDIVNREQNGTNGKKGNDPGC